MPAADVFRITAFYLFGENYEEYINTRGTRELAGITAQEAPLRGHDRRFTDEETTYFHGYFGADAEIFQQALRYVRVSSDSSRAAWRREILEACLRENIANADGEPLHPPNEEACVILLDKLFALAQDMQLGE